MESMRGSLSSVSSVCSGVRIPEHQRGSLGRRALHGFERQCETHRSSCVRCLSGQGPSNQCNGVSKWFLWLTRSCRWVPRVLSFDLALLASCPNGGACPWERGCVGDTEWFSYPGHSAVLLGGDKIWEKLRCERIDQKVRL